ncbi:MAG: glutaredoxin family protein [Myxococcota bacterium]
MRTIPILLVLAALVGAHAHSRGFFVSAGETGAEMAGGEPGAPASSPHPTERLVEVDPQELVDGHPNETDRASRDEASISAESGKPTYYQWVDERGSVHFAGSLDEVPAAWRSRAGQIQLDPGAFNRTSTPAAKPVRPRPIAEAAARNRNHDVTIYTAPWCGWCRKTIAFLDQRGIDYVNKDIDEDAAYADELREKSGGTAIPFVEIDGSAIRGFDPDQMTALLD